MADFDALQRVWLVDWFGYVIGYDADYKALRRQLFVPCEYPDTFIISAWPLKTPSRVMLRRTSFIPQGLPEAQFVEAGKHLVGLETQGAPGPGTYLSINPRNGDMHWHAGTLNDWERFIPMTKGMLDGLSVLMDRALAEVRIKGEAVGPLGLPDVAQNVGNFFWLGEHRVSISRNLEKFAKIGEIAEGKSADVFLLSPESDQVKLTVTRTNESLEEEYFPLHGASQA